MSLIDSISEHLDVSHLGKVAGPLKEMLSGDGVHQVLGKLDAAGLGDTVKSWVGLTRNLPISADQIASALGNDTVQSIAAKVGIPTDKVASALAHLLPTTIDKMTPDGAPPAKGAQVPDLGDMIQAMQAAVPTRPTSA